MTRRKKQAYDQSVGVSRRLLTVYAVIFGLLVMVAGWLSLKNDNEHTQAAGSDEQSAESAVDVAIVDIIRKRYYVTAETLNVRRRPGTRNPVVGHLEQYDDIVVEFPTAREGWARIFTEDDVEGYVSLQFVAPGNGKSAFRAHCLQSVTRPTTGQLIQPAAGGHQSLRVEAPSKHDVSVRLENHAGNTALLGYIRAGQVYSFAGVPAGRYQLGIGAGQRFSAECGLFTETMEKALFTRSLVFEPALLRSPDAHYQVTIQLKSSGEAAL